MAEASKTVEMSVPLEKLRKVILDYEQYPKFVDGCHKVKIRSKDKGKVQAEYSIELLGKEIFYVLDHVEEGSDKIKWKFVESNILKDNHGYWVLKDLGNGRTEVTYSLALDFKIYVPGMILNGLVKSSLPKMLNSFEKRTRAL